MIVPISILIEAFDLKDDDNQRHDGLDEAELKCSLFAEPESANVITVTSQATCAVKIAGLDWFSTNFRHNVPLATQIFVAKTQKVVDDEGLVTVPDCIEVNIVVVISEEKKAEPRGEGVEGNYEQDPHNPSLFCRVSVVS